MLPRGKRSHTQNRDQFQAPSVSWHSVKLSWQRKHNSVCMQEESLGEKGKSFLCRHSLSSVIARNVVGSVPGDQRSASLMCSLALNFVFCLSPKVNAPMSKCNGNGRVSWLRRVIRQWGKTDGCHKVLHDFKELIYALKWENSWDTEFPQRLVNVKQEWWLWPDTSAWTVGLCYSLLKLFGLHMADMRWKIKLSQKKKQLRCSLKWVYAQTTAKQGLPFGAFQELWNLNLWKWQRSFNRLKLSSPACLTFQFYQ